MNVKNNLQLEKRTKLQGLIRSLSVKFKLGLKFFRPNIKLYFVGQYKEQKNTYEIQGIFSTENKALVACKDRTYFIVPLILDKASPHETVKWDGYYPLEN